MASLTELFEFLDSPNPSARHLALQNLIGHTAKGDPQRHIFIPSSLAGVGSGGLLPEKRKQGSEEDAIKVKAIKDLCSLCQDQAVSRQNLSTWTKLTVQFIAHDALSGLINLSDTLAAAKHMVDERYIVWLVSYTSVSTHTLTSRALLMSEHHFTPVTSDFDVAVQLDISYVTLTSNSQCPDPNCSIAQIRSLPTIPPSRGGFSFILYPPRLPGSEYRPAQCRSRSGGRERHRSAQSAGTGF